MKNELLEKANEIVNKKLETEKANLLEKTYSELLEQKRKENSIAKLDERETLRTKNHIKKKFELNLTCAKCGNGLENLELIIRPKDSERLSIFGTCNKCPSTCVYPENLKYTKFQTEYSLKNVSVNPRNILLKHSIGLNTPISV